MLICLAVCEQIIILLHNLLLIIGFDRNSILKRFDHDVDFDVDFDVDCGGRAVDGSWERVKYGAGLGKR